MPGATSLGTREVPGAQNGTNYVGLARIRLGVLIRFFRAIPGIFGVIGLRLGSLHTRSVADPRRDPRALSPPMAGDGLTLGVGDQLAVRPAARARDLVDDLRRRPSGRQWPADRPTISVPDEDGPRPGGPHAVRLGPAACPYAEITEGHAWTYSNVHARIVSGERRCRFPVIAAPPVIACRGTPRCEFENKLEPFWNLGGPTTRPRQQKNPA